MNEDDFEIVVRRKEQPAPEPSRETPLLLTVDQAAERLNVSSRTVYLLMREHRLDSLKVAGARRIPVDAIDRFIAVGVENDQARRTR